MLYLKTGTPGAGKTLNAIKFVLEDDRFKNRQVYYYNINGLNIPDWIELTKEEMERWYELPKGSVIVGDEIQRVWRPRKAGSPVPKSVEELETNRHGGFDLILTCQYPRQIDIAVRRMVAEHFHYYRPFGMKTTSVLQYQKCEENPQDYHTTQTAQKKRVKLDPKIFDLYKSAEIHTVKRTIPKKLLFIPVLIIALVFVLYFLYTVMTGLGKSEDELIKDQHATDQPSSTIGSALNLPSDKYRQQSITPLQYVQMRQARLPNDPASAPVYDEVKEVVTYPIPNCLMSTRPRQDNSGSSIACTCYSQQATRMNIDQKTCIHYVNKGFSFDPYRPDKKFNREAHPNRFSVPFQPNQEPTNTQPQPIALSSLR